MTPTPSTSPEVTPTPSTPPEATPTPTPSTPPEVTPPPSTPTPPTPTPPTPPTPPTTPPVIIEDNEVPTGFLPRKKTYSISDGTIPLGALPNTSGTAGVGVGSMGILTILAGIVLGWFGKKKKED